MKLLLLLLLTYSTLFADWNVTEYSDYTNKKSHSFRKMVTRGYHRFLYMIDASLSDEKGIDRACYRKIRDNKLLIILSIKQKGKIGLHLKGKIALPRLKHDAELIFSQNHDQELDNQNIISSKDDVIKGKKLRAGLKLYLYREKKSAAYAKLSFKIRSPFGPYLKFGIDKSYTKKNNLEITLNHALYYYPNGNDVSLSTALSFFKVFSNSYWGGQGNKLYWEDNKFYLDNKILFYHIMNLNNRIIYKIDCTNSYHRHDKFATDVFGISTGYYHRFDKWFFMEAIPRIEKRRKNHYQKEFLFTLNFGMLLEK